jgi:hypothetical protein
MAPIGLPIKPGPPGNPSPQPYRFRPGAVLPLARQGQGVNCICSTLTAMSPPVRIMSVHGSEATDR